MSKKRSDKSSSSSSEFKQGNHVHNSFQGLNRGAVKMLEDRIGQLEYLLKDTHLDEEQKKELSAKIGAAQEAVKTLTDMYGAYDSLRGHEQLGTDSHAVKERTDILAFLGSKLGSQDQKGGDFNSLAFSHCQRVLLQDMFRALNQHEAQLDSTVELSLDCLMDNSVDPIALSSVYTHSSSEKEKKLQIKFVSWNTQVTDAKQAYRQAFLEALRAVNNAAAYAEKEGLRLFEIEETGSTSRSIDGPVEIAPRYEPDFSKKAGQPYDSLLSHLQTRKKHPRLDEHGELLVVVESEWKNNVREELQKIAQPDGARDDSLSQEVKLTRAKEGLSFLEGLRGDVPDKHKGWFAKRIITYVEGIQKLEEQLDSSAHKLKESSDSSHSLSDGVPAPERSADLVPDPVQGPSANSTFSTSSSSAADGEGDVDVADTELAESLAQNSEDSDIAGIRNATENHGESADTPGILKASPPVGESSSAAAGVPSPLPVPPAAELSLPRHPEALDPGKDSLPGPSSTPGRAPQTVAEVLLIANDVVNQQSGTCHLAEVLGQLADDNPDFAHLAEKALAEVLARQTLPAVPTPPTDNAQRRGEAVKNAKDTLRLHAFATAEAMNNEGDEARRNSILQERMEEFGELSEALMLYAGQFSDGCGVATGSEKSALSSSSSSSSSHEAGEARALPSDVMGIALLADELRERLQPNQQRDQTTFQASMDTGLDSSSSSLLSREDDKLLADKAGEQPEQVDECSPGQTVVPTGQSSSSSSLSGSKVGDVLQSQRAAAAAAARPRSLSTGNTVLDNLRSPPAGGRPRSLSAPSRLETPQADGATSRGTGPRHT